MLECLRLRPTAIIVVRADARRHAEREHRATAHRGPLSRQGRISLRGRFHRLSFCNPSRPHPAHSGAGYARDREHGDDADNS